MIIRRRSIFFRLLVSHLLVILLLALAFSVLQIYVIYNGNGPLVLRKRVTEIADYLASRADTKPILDLQTWQLLGKETNATLWMTDTEGSVIGGTPPEGWSANHSLAPPTTDSTFTRSFIMAVPTKVSGKPAVLYAYQDSHFRILFGRTFFLIPFLIGVLIAILLGFLSSSNLTKSITNIATAASRFSSGNRDSRTTTTGDDELGDLGRNFNAMADSITRTEKTRREFYANASHELKTPLSCMQATTEALIDGIAKTPEDYRKHLRNIHSEILRMTRMIRDLLDLEQLEAGSMNIRRDRVDIRALLSQQADKIHDLLKTKNLSLVLSLKADHCFIWGDPDRLTQVFDNLLSNAIRHSPQGSRISIVLANDNTKLKISVSDQGEGVSESELPLIWERFYRTDKSRTRASGGSGLGLSITRSLVEAMGGAISVSSTKKQGTTFTIEFPIA
ncbi:Hypothetical protein LUCI_4800 [Lucifera butyrica]|uniref:histidine kinase n=1 Tax=Lucifera butyrica TaxID=1351585 RepID=A0A498RES3_9FIRM|nr:HAMP domain-containing sensor histidine kinase [Lucifera butyrica]VBB09505.1 Hypothetical protein LUCI_4800 [Lucifera butyrica]